MSSKGAVKSSNGGEVFRKAMLSLSSDLPKESKNRQKRKERQPKPKSTVQKATTTRRQKNSLSQVKTKATQMANRENEKATEKNIKSGIAEKLSLLRNPKVISSEPITTKRKPLATIQSSNVSSVSRRPPTSNRLEKDLRRVLAQEDDYDRSKATSGVSSDSKSQKSKKGAVVTSECKSPVKGGSSKRHGESASPTNGETDMDTSPKTAHVPLREISLRLVEGLQTSVIFPESSYLDNVKAELKKLMKQSDPEAYGQLMLCISDKHEDSPAINAAILAQRRAQNDDGSFNILFPRFFDEATSLTVDSNPLHSLFDSTTVQVPAASGLTTDPVDHVTFTEANTISSSQTSTSQHCEGGSSLLPSIIQHNVANPVSQLGMSPCQFHLPTVILHPDTEHSTGDNFLSQPPLLEGDHMSFNSGPSGVDFLDYLDAGSLNSTSDTQYRSVSTGVEYNHTVDIEANPAHQWMPTPDRPRMFPRKLY